MASSFDLERSRVKEIVLESGMGAIYDLLMEALALAASEATTVRINCNGRDYVIDPSKIVGGWMQEAENERQEKQSRKLDEL
jgi:hypothetical protein